MRRATRTALTATTLVALAACGAGGEDLPEVGSGPVDGATDGADDDGADDDGADDDGADDDGADDAAIIDGGDGPREDLGGGGAPDAAPVDGIDGAVAAAVDDLAATAGVDATDVEVVSAEPVTWSDGSLGCPEDGQMYTQALVPGYRVVLAVDGTEVAYHGAEDAAPTRCDDPRPPAEGAS